MSAAGGSGMALRKLAGELRSLEKEPLEGVSISADESNIFVWNVGIFGPPDTPYAGGYFRTRINFPDSYPFEPPKMSFVDPFHHPNVYPSGELCISILHPPGEDAMSGERPEERWNPTQQVRTILLSVISLLNEPNTFSPANVDASVEYRNWKEGKSTKYIDRVREQVARGRVLAQELGIDVPLTVEEYCIKHEAPAEASNTDWLLDDYDDEEEDDGFLDDDFMNEDGDFDCGDDDEDEEDEAS